MTTVQFVLFENRFRVTRDIRNADGSVTKEPKMVDEHTLRQIGDDHVNTLIEECKIDPLHARVLKRPAVAKRGMFVGYAL